MAAHQLVIAKASLTASFLRPDPSSVGRDEISRLLAALDSVAEHCSADNVQRCKSWIIENALHSQGRMAALAKYIAALAGAKDDEKPSKVKRMLHLLYLIHDLFHHVKHHSSKVELLPAAVGSLEPTVLLLVEGAASCDKTRNPRHHRRLNVLIELWDKASYYSDDIQSRLRQAAANTKSSQSPIKNLEVEDERPREVPFVMPATHGEPGTPYYDLPAGNMVAHIVPNSFKPINPALVKPLQLSAGAADPALVAVLKDFLLDTARIYNGTANDDTVDVDALGQSLVEDELGQVKTREAYYGWSIEFCQRMRKRKRGDEPGNGSRESSRSGRSGTVTPPLRRGRHSRPSQSPSRSRSRSYSPPGAAPLGGGQQAQYHQDGPAQPGRQQTRYDWPVPPPGPFPGTNVQFPPPPGPWQQQWPPPLLPGHGFPPPPPPSNMQGQWPPPPPPPPGMPGMPLSQPPHAPGQRYGQYGQFGQQGEQGQHGQQGQQGQRGQQGQHGEHGARRDPRRARWD